MSDIITCEQISAAAMPYFLPMLLQSEDFDTFETDVVTKSRVIQAKCIKMCLEAFDELVSQFLPRGWTLHEKSPRTLITLSGAVTYLRSIYLDQYGRRRIWIDELLGIPKKTLLSTGAFLWIVKRASEFSYRKTAADFEAFTGEHLSHVTVMRCVHKEGELLRAQNFQGDHISTDKVFVEVDGVYIHFQNPAHRKHALPRFLYEQAHRSISFELKMACTYIGKNKTKSGRMKRDNLSVVVADSDPDSFWNLVSERICADYDIEDLEEIWLGHDGGSWCKSDCLELSLPRRINVIGSLDPFHVMKYITKAFPEGPERDWAMNLACRGKGKRLSEMSWKIAEGVKSETRKKKICDLARYAQNNASDIIFPKQSLGTMEGTNYHIAAKRCKNNGTSWSRRGAEAICLIRAAIASGDELIIPDKGQFFTKYEKEKEKKFLNTFTASSISEYCGKGYTLPHSQISLPKVASISLAYRS